MIGKTFIIIGAINAFLTVAIGAFGAHGLKGKITDDLLTIYQTGVQYHMFHSLGLIAVGILASKMASTAMLTWSGWAMLIGIILFSGSLYVLSLSGIRVLGAITPFGGVAFLIGWALLAIAAYRG
ncbi:DUF423 domain-containing protein [Ammoniphilus sp. CFH 90114]|uniref:DUF423 domain-containing protein n=1 Tax=Ammoniphilus sp. CFH 90114 TaxID=2493665 RepID=UPI00100DBAE8|nr:DUF423 domain-containing protein [Ammoniphilus sp. CFH 90114]RXT04890.1 DUF423 domain-containing protein [Ammoniphilus sp. CFH 90114]